MKKICAITMARNDEFFLSRWIKYYSGQLGEENLFVFFDGEDQTAPKNAGKTNIIFVPRVAEHVVKAEKRRLRFLSEKAAELFEKYDVVIGVDADEFLVVEPKINENLAEYLGKIEGKNSVSALGIDVAQHREKEQILDCNLPFFEQRNFAMLSSRYTKPSVIFKPLRWGSGFHRVKGHNFRIDKNLYLFHFGSVDYEMIRKKFSDIDFISTGRARHLKKRTRSITFVTKKRAKNGDKIFPIVRLLQTIFRPVYALNKPSMLGWKPVIKIPERFQSLL
ncbi:MAG: glycosyltransferase family 2 protein [Prevotellaceae bacterium]|jgi:hypothetical protein|nr:glycosyltransferase family 2 protein [Prevotellaceae bacterium]